MAAYVGRRNAAGFYLTWILNPQWQKKKFGSDD